jgi:adenosine deaminase
MKQLAKIELHCHLDGSLRPETVLELAKKQGVETPVSTIKEIKEYLTAPADCPSLAEYLKRFDLPIALMQTEEALERVAFELMEDSAKENVKYIEIRFAPLFHQEKGLSIEQIIESVLKGIKRAEAQYEIKGNLILSFLKFMPSETIKPVLDLAKPYMGKGVVAVDLAGNEDEGFAKDFIDAMTYAKTLGYHITVHAGETGFGINVLESIELLGAERIGHGVNIRDHEGAFERVKALKIPLEMCPTSNVQTKAVKSAEDHPIVDFIKSGIQVTLNTDNRTVSDTTMVGEIELCQKTLSLTEGLYREIYQMSIEASFASTEIKKWLGQFS